MKYSIRFLLLGAWLFSASALAQTSAPIEPAPPGQTKTNVDTTHEVQGGTPTATTHITGSDDLAMGDPLGNHAMTPRADAGPANTQRYCEEGSTEEHCVRATRRNSSPTTWQQDCARGLSTACGYR